MAEAATETAQNGQGERKKAGKQGIGPRVMKDWRRFAMRLSVLEELGEGGVRGVMGVR
jgi:hypothetical protein